VSDAVSAPPAGAPPAHELPARLRAAVWLGAGLIGALARTWRVREVGRGGWRRAEAEGRPVVLAFWHGQMLPMLVHHRDRGAAVLISEHRDGEIIARVVRAFGLRAVRGSTSRGGGRALLELAAELRRGSEVAVTPDGPRGPRHAFAPGALVAAQRGGAPIVALVAHVDRAWRLRSWDRFEIPKPFARVTIAYSEPLPVGGGSAREAAAEAPRFEQVMTELADVAERAAAGRD
jgi:lysophospholipid acyltransferase (LPLAT)-like uncharacterized protein